MAARWQWQIHGFRRHFPRCPRPRGHPLPPRPRRPRRPCCCLGSWRRRRDSAAAGSRCFETPASEGASPSRRRGLMRWVERSSGDSISFFLNNRRFHIYFFWGCRRLEMKLYGTQKKWGLKQTKLGLKHVETNSWVKPRWVSKWMKLGNRRGHASVGQVSFVPWIGSWSPFDFEILQATSFGMFYPLVI